MIIGKLTKGAAAVSRAPDTKEVVRQAVPAAGYLVKVTAWLDGLGGGTHDQEAVAVVYDVAGNLLGVSPPVTVPAGSAADWYDFGFAGEAASAGVAVAAGSYDIGLHLGGVDSVIRFFSDGGGLSRRNADPYDDGPSDPFGTSTAGTDDMTVYGHVFSPWEPAVGVTEEWYARLPFAAAQAVFLAEGAKPGLITSTATWHGTHFDPQTGSFAVVRDDGPLADLVGERLSVSIGSSLARVARVGVFVHSMGPVYKADISLTRRAFAAISLLAVGDSIPVTIEVLG